MTFEYKNEFVDVNPYLVYSPDAEATASGDSGGGAGGITVLKFDQEGKIDITAGKLIELIETTLVYIYDNYNGVISNIYFAVYYENVADPIYNFVFMGAAPDGQTQIYTFTASTEADKPEIAQQ